MLLCKILFEQTWFQQFTNSKRNQVALILLEEYSADNKLNKNKIVVDVI